MAHRLALALLLLPLASSAARAGEVTLSPTEQRRNERIDRFLLDSMRAGDLEAWIVLTREGNLDPLSRDLGFGLGRAGLLFVDRGGDRVERWAAVSSLDLALLRDSGIYDHVLAIERDEPFEAGLARLFAQALPPHPPGRGPRRIGVNMSAASGIADGLSATSRDLLARTLESETGELVSAERTVLSFRSKRLPAEIELYREATARTHAILHEALTDGFIEAARTTQAELRDHVQGIALRHGFPDLAWEPEQCPGVYSGAFTDLSHAEPGARVLQPGDILWLDFGIRYQGYATDMIRAAYLLRERETVPPPEVARMFETVVAANRAAVAAMRPGVFGYQVDAAARAVVTGAGYPEYFHAAGHPVGFEVHDAGPSLGPRAPKYGAAVDLPLEAGQIFAVEPSVMLPREGGPWIVNVEEEVVVTADGAAYLSPPQEALYLIPARPSAPTGRP